MQVSFPTTPKQKRIEKILKHPSFRDVSNAGRLTILLAKEVFFCLEDLRRGSLGGKGGQLDVLDEEKMAEIETIVMRMYRPSDPKALWSKCRYALSKRCQVLRKHWPGNN